LVFRPRRFGYKTPIIRRRRGNYRVDPTGSGLPFLNYAAAMRGGCAPIWQPEAVQLDDSDWPKAPYSPWPIPPTYRASHWHARLSDFRKITPLSTIDKGRDITANFHQVADHHPFSLAGEFQIAEFDQFSLNPAVAGVLVADDRKGHCLGA